MVGQFIILITFFIESHWENRERKPQIQFSCRKFLEKSGKMRLSIDNLFYHNKSIWMQRKWCLSKFESILFDSINRSRVCHQTTSTSTKCQQMTTLPTDYCCDKIVQSSTNKNKKEKFIWAKEKRLIVIWNIRCVKVKVIRFCMVFPAEKKVISIQM